MGREKYLNHSLKIRR